MNPTTLHTNVRGRGKATEPDQLYNTKGRRGGTARLPTRNTRKGRN